MDLELTHTRATWQPLFVIGITFLSLAPTHLAAEEICVSGSAFQFVEADFPASVGFDPSGRPDSISATDQKEALEHAIDQWNAVTCSAAALEETSSPVINIFWANPDDTNCIQPNEVGFTLISPCEDFTSRTILMNSGETFLWAAEPDPYQGNATPLTVDVRSVLTHELGHALGLGHVDDTLATMAAKYLRDGGQSTLAAIDKSSLCAAYPVPTNECETDEDCDGQCVGDDGAKVCDERRASIGEFCALDDRVCAVCFLSSPDTFSGYCSQPCEGECPEDFECTDGFCRLQEVPEEGDGCATSSPQHLPPVFLFFLCLIGGLLLPHRE